MEKRGGKKEKKFPENIFNKNGIVGITFRFLNSPSSSRTATDYDYSRGAPFAPPQRQRPSSATTVDVLRPFLLLSGNTQRPKKA